MARESAKKNHIRNQNLVLYSRLATILINLVYALVSSFLTPGLTIFQWIQCATLCGTELVSIRYLASYGAPTFDDVGNIAACNPLFPQEGQVRLPPIPSLAQDALWTAWAVHVLVLFWGGAFWLLLWLPIYGVYLAYGMFSKAKSLMGGMTGSVGGDPSTATVHRASEEKRQRRLDRKRGGVKYQR